MIIRGEKLCCKSTISHSDMLKRLAPKSEFTRNVLTLMTGTSIAQAIPVAISPILTRIYTPEDFGVFASYIGFVGILGALSVGRLDMAIMLPRKNEDAIRIILVALIISLIFVFIQYFSIFTMDRLEEYTNFSILSWHYLIPCGVFFHGFYSIMLSWHNRKKNYDLMSQSRIIQSSSISVLQVVVGYFNKFNFGLIVSDLIGRLISIILIVKKSNLLTQVPKFNKVKKIALLKRYKKFPLLEAPASLVNVSAHQLPLIFLPLIFSPAIAGQYFLVYRVLMLPTSFIGSAVLEVFKNQSQEDFRNTGSCRAIFMKTGFALFFMGLVPTSILIIFAPSLFSFIFGEEWRNAGEYAQILAPLVLIQLVSAPLSYILVFREKLFLDLNIQIFFLILVISVLWFATVSVNIENSIWWLMLSGCIFYFIQLVFSYKYSKSKI